MPRTIRRQRQQNALSLASRLERYAQAVKEDLGHGRPAAVHGKALTDIAAELAAELRAIAVIDEVVARMAGGRAA